MDIRLDGRTALVTGASFGLGRAMAHAFADAGAQVAMLARRAAPLAAAEAEIADDTGGRVLAIPCDVRDARQIEVAVAEATSQLGPIDILVNNAGTSRTMPFLEGTDEIWQDDIDLKLMAAVRLTRLVLPGMRERRWGRIINVLNTQAKAPRAGSAPTSVTRAAGMALTKALAQEAAPWGVLVNAMLVGFIETNQWREMHQKQAPEKDFSAFIESRIAGVPIGRIGQPEEFAALALFLASDAGSYITGTAINVDGGMSPVV